MKLVEYMFLFGREDSVATAIIAKEKGEPLDAVVFAEVMFDEETSGEHPLHQEFVYSKLQPFVVERLKVPFIVVRSPVTYTDFFKHIVTRGNNKGKTAGFPLPGMCGINRDCKMKAIRNFKIGRQIDTEYVGIASDEPKRLDRLNGNKVSLLAKYEYTEEMAKRLCQEYGVLSPVYDISKRNGCWFCMNCCDTEFIWLIKNRPDLFNKLVELETTHPERARICFTRKETPTQLLNRLEVYTGQLSFFE